MAPRWLLLLLLASSCVGTAELTDVEPVPSPLGPGATDAGGRPEEPRGADAGLTSPGVDAGAAADAGAPMPPVDAGAPLDAGPPPPCGALDARVEVARIDVGPVTVDVGSSSGWSNNRPVHLAGLADGTSRVAWSGGGAVHVTPLTPGLQRAGPDQVVAGESVRGLVAHDDGAVALLVVRGTAMVLVTLGPDGAPRLEVPLVADAPSEVEGARWVDGWGHEGRLVFTGTHYVAYFGHTRQWGAQGKHQGDLLESVDATTGQVGGPAAWWWGCSHSLDVRLAWDGRAVAPVCLSDCYPTKAVLLGHSATLQLEPSGNCSGGSSGQLGGLAALPGGGFAFTFATTEGRGSRDVGFLAWTGQPSPAGVVWLAAGAADESEPHLARYGSDRLLASWREGGAERLAVLSAAGAVLEGPAPAEVGLAERDDFATFPSGDVAWARGVGPRLEVRRVRACAP